MRVVPLAPVVALLLSMLPFGESPAASPAALFDTSPTVPAASSGVASRATVRQRPVTSRLGLLVRPDGSAALGAGERVQLNLFDDADFSMTVTDVTRHAGHGLTWSGTLDGVDHGSVVLVVRDDALVGQVATPQTVYRIGYAPEGTQVVEEIDPGTLPREAPPISPPPAAPADSPSTNVGAEIPDVAADTAARIDVMVLYTAAARAAAGGTAAMRAEVDLFVSLANQIYANTDLVQRLHLVYAGEIAITETTGDQDLPQLRANPTVAKLRDFARADLVSLITDHGAQAFCGIGYLMITNSTSFAPNGFSVVERTCASTIFTLAHELGHNMGGHHDPFVSAGEATMFPYSHGYVDLVGKFRTIMAYPDQCIAASVPCNRIMAFSSPGFTSGGRAIGTAATSDNSRTLGQTGDTVASFRQALTSPLTLTAAVNQPTFAVGDTLVASVSLNHPGGVAGAVDFYVGVLFSNGSAVFFTDVTITPTSGYALGTITNLATYSPIATGIPLGGPFSANLPTFFTYPRGAGDPTGGFAFFVFAVKSGVLTGSTFTSDQLLAASLAPFTFPATSPGDAPCASADCAS